MAPPSLEYIAHAPPSHYTLAFVPFLYNQKSFLELKNYSTQSFYAVDHERQTVIARIHFAIQIYLDGQKQAISLPESPFGSLEGAVLWPIEQILAFVNYVTSALAKQDCTHVEIRHYLTSYSENAHDIARAFQHAHFVKSISMVNHHIAVDQQGLSDKMSAGQRGKLKKCLQTGFAVVHESPEKLAEVYLFIEASYRHRQRTLSMPLPSLQKQADTLEIFSVYDRGKRVSACIAVRVTETILYTFYYTALPDYQSYSPTVLLLKFIYQHCQTNHITILDLGTSTTESVQRFKARMGGIPSLKDTFSLVLTT